MDLHVILLIIACVTTLFLAWKYSKALKVIAKLDVELLENYNRLRYELDAAVHTLRIKQEEADITRKTIAEHSALINSLEAEKKALEANCREFAEKERRLRDEHSKRETQWEAEKRALEVYCRDTAERERRLKSDHSYREKEWEAEKASMQYSAVNYQVRLAELADKLKQSERANEAQRVQQLQMPGWPAQGGESGEISALKGQVAALSSRTNQLNQELAERNSAIASLRQAATDLRNNAGKEKQDKSQALQTQLDQLKAKTDKERSAALQDLARLKTQLGQMTLEADQWKQRFEGATRQCTDLQSAVEAKNRQVEALEERVTSAVSAPQGPSNSSLCIECVVCLDRQKCILFEPCRHICVCQQCSHELRTCPLCTRPIKKRKFGYLSL